MFRFPFPTTSLSSPAGGKAEGIAAVPSTGRGGEGALYPHPTEKDVACQLPPKEANDGLKLGKADLRGELRRRAFVVNR